MVLQTSQEALSGEAGLLSQSNARQSMERQNCWKGYKLKVLKSAVLLALHSNAARKWVSDEFDVWVPCVIEWINVAGTEALVGIRTLHGRIQAVVSTNSIEVVDIVAIDMSVPLRSLYDYKAFKKRLSDEKSSTNKLNIKYRNDLLQKKCSGLL